jgi:hypothetical protein
MGLDEGLGHLGDFPTDLLGHSFKEFFYPVGVDPIYDVDLGGYQYGVWCQVHGEQAQDLRNLGKGEHDLAYPPPVLGKDRFADEEPARVCAKLPGDEEE